MKCEECGSEDIEFHETYDTLGVAVSTRIIIIILVLLLVVIVFFRKFSSFVYAFAIIDIFLS